MASRWTHPVCLDDFTRLMPGREPVRVKVPGGARCCWCSRDTRDGIWIRWDPADIPAHRSHGD